MDRVSYGPFKLYESDAYKQARAMQAEKAQLELEKLQLDLAEKRREQELSSPSGRATMAADIAATLEQDRQKERARVRVDRARHLQPFPLRQGSSEQSGGGDGFFFVNEGHEEEARRAQHRQRKRIHEPRLPDYARTAKH